MNKIDRRVASFKSKNIFIILTFCRLTLSTTLDPLSFDPLLFDTLSFDPLSFDLVSFDLLSVNRINRSKKSVLNIKRTFRRDNFWYYFEKNECRMNNSSGRPSFKNMKQNQAILIDYQLKYMCVKNSFLICPKIKSWKCRQFGFRTKMWRKGVLLSQILNKNYTVKDFIHKQHKFYL